MDIPTIRNALLWCAVINGALLIFWFIFFALAHDWVLRMHGKWFKMSVEQFDAIHYAGMGLFRIAIIVFNIVPFFALLIVGSP